MNGPANAILDGLSIAGMHGRLIAAILLILLISLLLLSAALRRIFEDKITAEEYVSLSLGGWLLPASLLSLLWYTGAQILSPQFSTVLLGLLFIASLALSIHDLKAMVGTITLALILLAGLFILLRLAFVSKAVLPLYFDSAQHYLFIDLLLRNLEIPGAGIGLSTGYYHYGFHFLAAFLTFIASEQITDTMLVLGQVILAVMPFSIFFIVRYGTGSSLAGFFALALAAFGWYMPAHAVDWGKYPALVSLALIPFVLSLAYLSIRYRNILSTRKYLGLNALLLASTLISVFLHSRSLVVYFLLTLAWLITTAWNRLTKKLKYLLLGLFVLSLLAEISYIQSEGILGPLFDAYGRDAVLITLPVLVLSIFAYRTYPGFVFFCIASTSLLLASLFVPLVDLVPGYANTTLLDRPFVQMILYLPLTLLGGFGLAGLEQSLAGMEIAWGNTRLALGKVTGVIFISMVVIHALLRYDLYPADCCDIVSTDDLAAIHWMDENLPPDALILTSSTDLNVLPTDEYQGSAGGDAGTWITPLTARPVAYLPYHTDFSQGQTLESLCQLQVDYVYVGKTGWYFDDVGMSAWPEAYKIVLDLPKAKVYEIIGCG